MKRNIAQTRILPCCSLATCLGVWICWISPALAQVNGSGPSPSSSFDIALNLPGDEAIITGNANESIGGIPEQTTQLNISDTGVVGSFFAAESGSEVNISGGAVGDSFQANSGSEVNINGGSVANNFSALSGSEVNINGGSVGSRVNISGGFVGSSFNALSGSVVNINGGSVAIFFQAFSGSEVNINGGSIGRLFQAMSGSEVNISGGSVGRRFRARSDSDVELIGGEFRLNGANFDGGSISLSDGDLFTGTLSDGSAFIFSDASDSLSNVTLTPVSLPPLDTNPIVADAPVVGGPSGLRTGQQLTLVTGGSLGDNFAVVDAILNVDAGTVGNGLETYASVVNINGGSVGEDFDAHSGSEVNISGGFVGEGFRANPGSVVNISGGAVGGLFKARSGSDVELIGGEFRLNGANFDSGSISLSDGDVFTGTLADGSAFIFSDDSFDMLEDVTLTPVSLPPLDTNPIVVDAVVDGPSGLQAGQQLTVVAGGSLGDNFAVVDAILNVDAGTVGNGLEASGSVVNINGGSVGENVQALSDSEVNINGGSVGEFFIANSGSVVNISGGSVGDFFDANSGSEVNLFGTEFFLNGVLLDDLNLDQAFVITERDQILSGTLLDDSDFQFDLSDSFGNDSFDFFSTDALLTVTLVEEVLSVDGVCSALAAGGSNLALDANGDGSLDLQDLEFALNQAGSLTGDADGDGTVAFADFLTLSNSFGSSDVAYSSGDFNCDGNVAFDDFLILSANFGNSFSAVAAVPEPRSCAWLLVLVLARASRTRRNR